MWVHKAFTPFLAPVGLIHATAPHKRRWQRSTLELRIGATPSNIEIRGRRLWTGTDDKRYLWRQYCPVQPLRTRDCMYVCVYLQGRNARSIETGDNSNATVGSRRGFRSSIL
ncbi:hypothetical protein F5B20DRAFT_542036 [Whalleya microplaca]|nr:hypothetical protein F5B20DRAFT_542036 [Whalleya microplaca]